MSRLNLNEEFVDNTEESLDVLVKSYAFNKGELDSYKKICDDENTKIKNLMAKENKEEHTVDGITVKKVIQHKESMDENKLFKAIKDFNLPCIKTVEIVDMEALESYLYHNTDNLPDGFAQALNACKSTSEVVTLRISRKKA